MPSFRRCLTQNRQRLPFLILFILLLIGFSCYSFLNEPPKDHFPYRVPRDVETKLISEPFRQVAKECSNFNKRCFTVVDQTSTFKGRVRIDRILLINDLDSKAHSVVRMAIPEGLTASTVNTSTFPVDKTKVNEGYFQMMIVAPFATEALKLPSTLKQRVLLLGLGGGTISNFLSVVSDYGFNVETTVVEIDPFMVELSKKYFGTEEKKGTTNIVTVDGVHFLRKAVEKKVKYHSVMLDACYSGDELQNGQLCPVEPFFKDQTIQDIYGVLHEGGTLSINTVFEQDARLHEDRILEVYGKVFPSCDIVNYGAYQKMLICTKKKDWGFDQQKKRFLSNIRRVNKIFDFGLHKVL